MNNNHDQLITVTIKWLELALQPKSEDAAVNFNGPMYNVYKFIRLNFNQLEKNILETNSLYKVKKLMKIAELIVQNYLDSEDNIIFKLMKLTYNKINET